MFVAQRQIKDVRDGKPVVYSPGEVIPNFDKWNIHARRAVLNMDWVKEVNEGDAPEPASRPYENSWQKKAVTPKAASPAVECDLCKREFKNTRAMKTHVALGHRKTGR